MLGIANKYFKCGWQRWTFRHFVVVVGKGPFSHHKILLARFQFCGHTHTHIQGSVFLHTLCSTFKHFIRTKILILHIFFEPQKLKKLPPTETNNRTTREVDPTDAWKRCWAPPSDNWTDTSRNTAQATRPKRSSFCRYGWFISAISRVQKRGTEIKSLQEERILQTGNLPYDRSLERKQSRKGSSQAPSRSVCSTDTPKCYWEVTRIVQRSI